MLALALTAWLWALVASTVVFVAVVVVQVVVRRLVAVVRAVRPAPARKARTV